MHLLTIGLYVGALSLLVGCTTPMPGKKIDGVGPYLQSVYGDYVLTQIDLPSSGVCSAELNATAWNNAADLRCTPVSAAASLQFHGKAKLGNTGIEPDLHFRNAEQCQAFKDGVRQTGLQVTCFGKK